MHASKLDCRPRGLSAQASPLRAVPPHLVAPFSPTKAPCRREQTGCRRQVARAASETLSEAPAEPVASTSQIADVDKELVAEKARAGMHRFAASTRKIGTNRLIVDSLKRVSMTFLGEDHALTFAVAQIVGSRLGWFAVDLPKVICGMRKVASLQELSPEERAATEAEVLRGLRTQYRVIASPLPAPGGGAVGVEATWQDLWGSVIVWIDEEDKLRPRPRTPERALYDSKAELTVRVKVQKGFAVKGGPTLANRAKAVAEVLLPRLCDFLAEHPDLADRKRQYVDRGCRGDWPELQPAGWSPVAAALERKPLAGFEQATSPASSPEGPGEQEQGVQRHG